MIFGTLLNATIPLCLMIGMGYAAGRFCGVGVRSLSALILCFFQPIVYFTTIAQMDMHPALFLLPLWLFVMCNVMAVAGYRLARLFYKDNRANLVGMMSVAGNTGLFGLPLSVAVVGPQAAGLCMLANIGLMFAQNTTGYYIGARGHHSVAESVKRVFRLPSVYAAFAGLAWSVLNLPRPEALHTYGTYFIGAWVISGMMMIGIALAEAGRLLVNGRFLALLGVIKLLLWPALALAAVAFDRAVTGLFDENVHVILLIFGLTPLPGLSVSFSAHLGLRPGEVAAAVLISTLLAVAYFPAAFWLLGLG